MATKRKSKTRRSGVVKVYNTAEMTTSFPKSRKLMKQYKFTVYGDGTIVKSEIKQGASRKKPRKKSAKKRQKGRRYEKDSQRYFGVAWLPWALIGLGACGIGGCSYVASKSEDILNATNKPLERIDKISKTMLYASIVIGGIYVFSKIK